MDDSEKSKLVENEHDTAAALRRSIPLHAGKKDEGPDDSDNGEATFYTNGGEGKEDELYTQHQEQHGSMFGKQWWKSNFFVSEPAQFGTWDGVFTSCMINIFGILIFLRIGWMVGFAGVGCSLAIIFISSFVGFVAVTSAVGICERCFIEQSGIYFIINHVVGTRIAAPIGILYCFGQAVACALYVIGFGESISSLLYMESMWVARGIALALLFLLWGIHTAGVKWVIRFQLVLLLAITGAVLDFLIGSFVHVKPEFGFVGYNLKNLLNNMDPAREDPPLVSHNETESLISSVFAQEVNFNFAKDKMSFFVILGVFFPAAVGVFTGINMSGDLKNPSRAIPVGTFAALGTSTIMYVLFVFILGSTCLRFNLQTDYLIAEKVSGTGLVFLSGLYISSVSSGMGSLYGSPKILQNIAEENAFPFLSFLAKKGNGPDIALLCITGISLIFILIGRVNTLGPIVAVPFMLSYAAVNWAYFSLVTSYVKRGKNYATLESSEEKNADNYGTLDREIDDPCSRISDGTGDYRHVNTTITPMPKSVYSPFCNRWLSLVGALISIGAMFCIQWVYAVIVLAVFFVMYLYICTANPGVFSGISEFGLTNMFKNLLKLCCKKKQKDSQMIIPKSPPPTPRMSTSEVTDPNEDYEDRDPYHKVQDVDSRQLF